MPELGSGAHKGQSGKVAVVGGCREYTGAPYFAALSALKLGADLSHVFCAAAAAPVIKAYSPELIVHPVLRESHDADAGGGGGGGGGDRGAVVDRVVADVAAWLPRFDAVVVGPGLGRDPLVLECVAKVVEAAREARIPLVLDGDGLSLATSHPELVRGYELAVLTPNVNEYRRLVSGAAGGDEGAGKGAPVPDEEPDALRRLAESLGGVTIVQKGPRDLVSDGRDVLSCAVEGSPRRCGGQGDVLTGCIATFLAWSTKRGGAATGGGNGGARTAVHDSLSQSPTVAAAFAGCLLVRLLARAAFAKHRRGTVTGQLIDEMEDVVEGIAPAV
eukprot:SM000135S27022  [mRNA]  locus=s135:244987:246514:- [translate_table: standard]